MAEKRLIDADELLIAFGNALNNANLKIGYGFMEWVVNEQPTIDPESLRPTAKMDCRSAHGGRRRVQVRKLRPPRNIYIIRQAHRPCLLLPMRIQNGGTDK